jgi:hypothetical protein
MIVLVYSSHLDIIEAPSRTTKISHLAQYLIGIPLNENQIYRQRLARLSNLISSFS